jgi:hypothetical protein
MPDHARHAFFLQEGGRDLNRHSIDGEPGFDNIDPEARLDHERPAGERDRADVAPRPPAAVLAAFDNG